MKNNNVISIEDRERTAYPLTEMLREGAGKLIAQAIEMEINELLLRHAEERTEDGHLRVVRNGVPAGKSTPNRDWNCKSESAVNKQINLTH